MTNNKQFLINGLLALSLSSMASFSWAQCDRPAKPTVPNGAEADMQAMIAGQTAVKAFVADGTVFVECLEAEEKAGAAAAKGDEDAIAAEEATNAARIKVHNEVVDEMTTIAAEWKESMTAYKEKAASESES
ncbi:MAG: hypothetical protein AB8B86_18605 [Pseudomonadales bacterium]